MDLLSCANWTLPLLLFLPSLVKKCIHFLVGLQGLRFLLSLCAMSSLAPASWNVHLCTDRRTARAASSDGLGRIQETTDSWKNCSMTGNWSWTRREKADDNYRAFCFLGTLSWLLKCLIWNLCLVITVVGPIRAEVLVEIILPSSLPLFLSLPHLSLTFFL